MIITNLRPQDKGVVEFFTPKGVLYDIVVFNGENRDYAKKYFKPQLVKSKNLCEKEDLIGEWTVMFRGYEMSKIYFEMMPYTLPNQESHYEGCEVAYEIDITKPLQ